MSNHYKYRYVPSSKFTNTLVELVYGKVGLKVSPTKWVNVKDDQVPKEHLLTSQAVLRRWGKWMCVIQRKEECEGWRRDTKITLLPYTSYIMNMWGLQLVLRQLKVPSQDSQEQGQGVGWELVLVFALTHRQLWGYWTLTLQVSADRK